MSQTLEEVIFEAGNKFDGHVTNGSLQEIVKAINQFFAVKDQELLSEAANDQELLSEAANDLMRLTLEENMVSEGAPVPLGETVVVEVNTEIANFSDKSLVLRQRSYMNRNFAPLRNKNEILTPDVFRMVFKVGRTLSETLKYFANPELMDDESQVDGDPGDARKRMLRP